MGRRLIRVHLAPESTFVVESYDGTVQRCTRVGDESYVGRPEIDVARELRRAGALFVDLINDTTTIRLRRGYRPRDTTHRPPAKVQPKAKPAAKPDSKPKEPKERKVPVPKHGYRLTTYEAMTGNIGGVVPEPDPDCPF